jgi:hypothetical protein
MTYECSGGSPRKFVVVKKPLKPGDIVKTGQYVRVEGAVNLTDDQVASICSLTFAPVLCQPSAGAHLTYYRLTNTSIEFEFKALQDFTVPSDLQGNAYIIQTLWEAYKIPIVIGMVAIGGFAGYMMLKRR